MKKLILGDKMTSKEVQEVKKQMKEASKKQLKEWFEAKKIQSRNEDLQAQVKQQQKELDFLKKRLEKAREERKCWSCGSYV